MDVANRLAQWKERSPEQWLRAANTFLPAAVTAILVIALAYRLAGMTWSIVPGQRLDGPAPEVAAFAPQAPAAAAIPQAALDVLSEAHLFGEASAGAAGGEAGAAVVVEELIDAPDTTLNLLLAGVVSRRVSERGQAIIVSGGREQKIYSVGDTIDGTNGATLHSVYADRVLLSQSGRLESLRLPREGTGQVPPSAARIVLPARLGGSGSGNQDSLREVIGSNASRIADVIRLAPAVEQGQILGFRVNPGPDTAAFAALGLEPGDIVTEVNGTTLDDPNRGLQVFEALGEMTMANVTLLRNGNPQAIVIDTTQLVDLAENSQ